MNIRTFIISLVVATCTSCHSRDPQLDWALEVAKDHAPELSRVIAHYDSTAEPLKADAARFLIRNMPGRSTAHGRTLARLYAMQDTMFANAAGDFLHAYRFNKFVLDSLDWSGIRWRPDVSSVSADYLIRNIDQAFALWRQPWNAHVSFDDFCESILPYRLADEELEPWRDDFLLAFPDLLDTLKAGASMPDLCVAMNRHYKAHNYMYRGRIPSFRPSSLRRTLIAPCSDYTKLCIYICRSLGIPAHFDFTPQWANYPHGHEWCAILSDGEWADFMLGENTELGGHLRKCSNALTKVYRKTFAIQSPDEIPVAYAQEAVPPFFQNCHQKDVTDLYLPTCSITVHDLFEAPAGHEFVYLCVYDNSDWNAVGYGRRIGNTVRFDKVGQREAVYLPAFYVNGHYVAAQHPIRLFANGLTESLAPDTIHTREVSLTRKYYEMRVNLFMRNVRGGSIELSQDAQFRHADSFTIPADAGFNFQSIKTSGAYRYVRFRPAGRQVGQLAELEAYSPDGHEINATPISSGAVSATHPADMLTDKNTLSFAECNTTQDSTTWIGLDLGRVQPVAHVDFLGRSDDNFIRHGETYQLEYYDRGWRSLGTRVGKRSTQSLTYHNAPRNALFRLRNISKGNEVRIFTYGFPTGARQADVDAGLAIEKQLWY